MARTAEGTALTERHRLAQLALRASLLRDLLRLWPLFDVTDFETFDTFVLAAALRVQVGHRDSAGLAIRYLAEFRRLEDVPGFVAPAIAEPPQEVVTREALRATGLLGTLNARRAGFTITAAAQNGFVRLAGAATSLAMAGGRRTIIDTLARDPATTRWHRVTSVNPCAFCRMMAGRGTDVDFQGHDHCACMAEPAYSGSRPPPASETFGREWADVTAGLSGDDALRAFRQYVEQRGG